MKKFAALIAVAVLVAFAAPAFAAINPFMDVPMNHWAYDAIGQLAAHGILSGYPDGTYKGKQPTTRYEMASALARALAVVDMTKASKQDVEMLKRLVIEFKDELEALGVRVDDLDERVSVLESRLGGWKLSGRLRLDVTYEDSDDYPDGVAKGSSTLENGRLWIERYFGDPDNPMHLYAEMETAGRLVDVLYWRQFYVEIPFFAGTTLTAGRFVWNMENQYYLDGDNIAASTGVGGWYGFDSVLTNNVRDGLGITKNFGLGDFRAYLSHATNDTYTLGFGAWELMMMARLQFTEQIGFDLGGQIFLGDNSEPTPVTAGDLSFDNLWTVFAGLRFNFMDGVAFKGLFYHQQINGDVWSGTAWNDADADSTNQWRVIVDVNQSVLKFTSAWLEYGQADAGFYTPHAGALGVRGNAIPADLKYFHIYLGQEWTPKISTHLFYDNYDFDSTTVDDFAAYGLGVAYKYNDNVKFGLNYIKTDWDGNTADEDQFRFRTEVTF